MSNTISLSAGFKACPFQPWIVIQQQGGVLAPGQAPKAQINPMPCIGSRCAAFHESAQLCLAHTKGGFAVNREPGQ